TTLYGPASTLFGIEQAARAAGYFVSIVSLEAITEHNIAEALDHLAEQSVDGLIVIAPHRQAVEALASLPAEQPVVVVEGGEAPGRAVVCVDQQAGAAAVTRHLLELGHETVVHVAGPPDWLEAQARQAAWRATLAEAGAPVPPVLTGDWSPRSGYLAGQQLARRLARRAAGTPVSAADAHMARRLRAARRSPRSGRPSQRWGGAASRCCWSSSPPVSRPQSGWWYRRTWSSGRAPPPHPTTRALDGEIHGICTGI